VGGVTVSSERSQQMMNLLKRPVNLDELFPKTEDNQVTGFLGQGLPHNSHLWSKAGWTSEVRHDCAYIEIPDHPPYLLIVFTQGKENAQNQEILPFISKVIVEELCK
jgi:hypothetical protein